MEAVLARRERCEILSKDCKLRTTRWCWEWWNKHSLVSLRKRRFLSLWLCSAQRWKTWVCKAMDCTELAVPYSEVWKDQKSCVLCVWLLRVNCLVLIDWDVWQMHDWDINIARADRQRSLARINWLTEKCAVQHRRKYISKSSGSPPLQRRDATAAGNLEVQVQRDR